MKKFERRVKVEVAIKRELAQIIQSGELKDDRIPSFLTIVEVRLNKALSSAKVIYSLLDSEDPSLEVGSMAALRENAGKLSGMVARKLNLRYAPSFFFECGSLKESFDLINLINKVSPDDTVED